MSKVKPKLTLDRPTTYQIKVPGHLDESWVGEVTISVTIEENGSLISTLTGTFDQAGLHGLLHRLYSMGLPLVSVNCLDINP